MIRYMGYRTFSTACHKHEGLRIEIEFVYGLIWHICYDFIINVHREKKLPLTQEKKLTSATRRLGFVIHLLAGVELDLRLGGRLATPRKTNKTNRNCVSFALQIDRRKSKGHCPPSLSQRQLSGVGGQKNRGSGYMI